MINILSGFVKLGTKAAAAAVRGLVTTFMNLAVCISKFNFKPILKRPEGGRKEVLNMSPCHIV